MLINPIITEKSEELFVFGEGCLSFPKKNVKTERYVSVKVKTDNHPEVLSFSADSKEINDAFECACIQHEIDHLDGKLFVDYISNMKRDRIAKKIKKLTEQGKLETRNDVPYSI